MGYRTSKIGLRKNIGCRTSKIGCRTSKISCRMSRIGCRTTRIGCMTSWIGWRTSVQAPGQAGNVTGQPKRAAG